MGDKVLNSIKAAIADPQDEIGDMRSENQADSNSLTKSSIRSYLDSQITFWRDRLDQKDPQNRAAALLFIEAYQVARKDMLGEFMPMEGYTEEAQA